MDNASPAVEVEVIHELFDILVSQRLADVQQQTVVPKAIHPVTITGDVTITGALSRDAPQQSCHWTETIPPEPIPIMGRTKRVLPFLR